MARKKQANEASSTALVTPPQAALQPIKIAGLDGYIAAAYNLPTLSADEEHALAVRYQSSNDLVAAETLVRHNLRHVIYIARGYSGYGLPLADLIQEGAIGLMKAVKRYNPDRGVRLLSFAIHSIKAEIHEFIIKNWRIVKIATTNAQRKLFFKLRSMKDEAQQHAGAMNRDETQYIADALDVKYDDVVEMEKRMGDADVSFHPHDSDDEELQARAPSNTLIEVDSDPAENEERDDWETYRRERLSDALNELDERSREVVMSRRMTDSKQTLQALADKFEVSVERIRQIEDAAIKKLRAKLADCCDDQDAPRAASRA